MKILIKVFIVQLCCFPLFITDAMARDGGGRSRESSGGSGSRPNVRPSNNSNRNPITQSKMSNSRPDNRPSAKPAARPEFKPQVPTSRPAPRPDRPEAKPAERPDRPETKPAPKPNFPQRPETRPVDLPDRPDTKPADRPTRPDRPVEKPSQRPDRPDRPDFKPGEKPTTKPTVPNRPEIRPTTRPGNVEYPKPQKPMTLPANINKPANRPNNNGQRPETRPGKNTRPVKKPSFDNSNHYTNNSKEKNQWWNNNTVNRNNKTTINNNITNINRGGNRNYYNQTNINVNNNFKNNVNWSTNQKNWGYNPWWNRPATRPWYGGSWNCGWNSSYRYHSSYHVSYYGGYRPVPGYVYYDDHNDIAEAIGWGLVGWSLGKLIFDSGYQTYSNPYPAQPVPSAKGTQVTYTQPITVVAAQTAPAEEESEKMTQQSESYIAESQAAFKRADYLQALDFANKAVGEAPGDGALHEYRALVLFALGKYSEAAGVLNPVLAGGPGWDWSTMITLYSSQEIYTSQLESLENYSKSKPDAADARFLLGYHYMVCGHLDRSNAEFTMAAKLQPADSVSAQLRDLTGATSNSGDDGGDKVDEVPSDATPPPAPVPLEKLTGIWVSDKGAQGTVSVAFQDDGKFIWTYKNGEKSSEFGGDFSMNDNGLLVLDSDESQMVASVELPQDSQLKFVLSGGPPNDPGLIFVKK